MRVLISGCCGFVGRAFTKRLLLQGHDVTGVDNLMDGIAPDKWPGILVNKQKFDFHLMDIRQFLAHWSHEHEFDLVIHCAAIVGGRRLLDGDPLAVATNLSIDADLFNWIVRQKPMPRLIYFSSSAIYPAELQSRGADIQLYELLTDVRHKHVAMPELSYGFAKLAGEYLARCAIDKYGLDVKIYRPFGGYGGDQSLDYPFPSIVKRIVNGEDPVIVWGSGEQMRDFIHIDDIVEAVLVSMATLPAGEPLNLGTGVPTSFKLLAHDIARVLDKSIRVVPDLTKPEGVFARIADVDKLHRYYRPRITLEEGIRRSVEALTMALA